MQSIAGGWVYQFEFNKNVSGVFDQVWRNISRWKGSVTAGSHEELLIAMSLLPYMAVDMRRPLDPLPIAIDASLKGRGVCLGYSLTDRGRMAAMSELSDPRVVAHKGLVVVELFWWHGGPSSSL